MLLGSGFAKILPALLLLLAFTIVGGVIILGLRRTLKKPPSNNIAFTLGDLKKLRNEGAITDEEYERAKQSIIAAVKKSTTDSQKNRSKRI
tara:strand:+ start:176 stop:448 length:273 start_codon:yes stop_codon:yes gene_type:complete